MAVGAVKRRFSGRRTFTVRFTKEPRRKLRRARRVRFALVGVATDAQNRRVTARRAFRLR